MSRIQNSEYRGLPHQVFSELCKLNSELWLVGGSVRDQLLGRSCHDWDFVCRHAGRFARKLARKLKATFIILDEQNRIYRLVLPDRTTLDFAELQGRAIEEDLHRRDFTINAMAQPLSSTNIIDPLGGRQDLRKGIIRAVSDRSFIEDPLRLVRAFRFAAQFQFAIESKTHRMILRHRERLSEVAAERIREELLRLWKQPRSAQALRSMDRTGVLARIFPEIEACRRTAVRYYGKGGVLTHSFQTVENLEEILGRNVLGLSSDVWKQVSGYLTGLVGGYPRAAWLKWAGFLHDVGKPATAKMIKGRLRFFEHEHVGAELARRIAQRLRCSRHETQMLALWVRNHMRPGNLAAAARITDKALSRFFRDLGEDGIGMVLVSLADHHTYLSKKLQGKGKDPVENLSRRLLMTYFQERAKVLPQKLVNGHDLMRTLRMKPGPMIGKLLEAVQDAQAEGDVKTKAEALVFARKRAGQVLKR